MKTLAIFILCVMVLLAACDKKSTSEPDNTNGSEYNVDPDFVVNIYQPDSVCEGTTLLTDKHTGSPRLIEVNTHGEIVWEYVPPEEEVNVGAEVELLPNGHILFTMTQSGIYEDNRSGKTVWSHEDPKVSHDADRLENGNTLYVFGANDQKSDAQVKEVNSDGELVWAWYAKDHFDYSPYNEIYNGGWTHVNAVTRMENGHTLISIRNFNMLVEVDAGGNVTKKIEQLAFHPHDPLILDNGNILVISQEPQTNNQHRAIEIDYDTEEILWEYGFSDPYDWPTRDCNLLPNGNLLITTASRIVEVTRSKEVVWEFGLKDPTILGELVSHANLGFYKAERITD
ncbi:aryl-sulfate sulfotransferase [bacterium]|nr:aryl-sulfate sulfotransferase [bacterium]